MRYKTIIAVFCYKRAGKLRRSVEALLKNPESASMDLIFFCDGAKGEQDRQGVQDTRAYVDTVTGFRSITRIYRETNFSTGPNFMDGLSSLCLHYDQFLVVEDDLVITPNYLRYMLDGLDHYREHSSVFCLTGYNFPIDASGYPYDSFVGNRFCSYGWASWSDRVRNVIWDNDGLKELIGSSPGFRQRLNGEGKDLYHMLIKQIGGVISTWDIQMQVHVSEHRLKVIYPVLSKAENIGFGSDSTNTFGIDYLQTKLDPGFQRVFSFCDPFIFYKDLQRQLKRPYGLKALATRKALNSLIKLTAPIKKWL